MNIVEMGALALKKNESQTLKKTTRLKQIIQRKELDFLMEAHNGLSAKVVEEAGFAGIWGSGLAISAALGVRDNNEASWTQVLDVAEFMADAANVPILLDGDTGYGNFNSARRLVRKLEQRGIAGVCMEDKLFPKTNSFLRSGAQPLADPKEFAGKIRAAKEAQLDPDFVVVARVEALIAGHGLDEALRRAEMYEDAGADAVLIHSSKGHADEIEAFMKRWKDRLPVVIVPTKYYRTPTGRFRELGISLVIWANHVMRSALVAMQQAANEIFAQQTVVMLEPKIAPLGEVFRLQGDAELEHAEELYLPKTAPTARAIVLAASRGEGFGELTADKPKCMLPINGKSLLEHIAATYRDAGVHDITVVRGYKKAAVDCVGLDYVDNDDYETRGEVASLERALAVVRQDLLVSYGDVLFRKYVAQRLLDHPADFVIAVDADWKNSNNRERLADYVQCSVPNGKDVLLQEVVLRQVLADATAPGIHGEWMGLLKVRANAIPALRAAIAALSAEGMGDVAKLPELLNRLMRDGHVIHIVYTTGDWLDVDSIADMLQGRASW